MALVFKPLEGVKNILGESTSICQMQKCSSLLAGYKTPHDLMLICLFPSQLSGNSDVWSSTDSRFGDFRLMEYPILVENGCSQIDCSGTFSFICPGSLVCSDCNEISEAGGKAEASKGSCTVCFE